MTPTFRIILIVVSLCTVIFVVLRIRSSKIRIEDSIFWIVLSLIILVMSVFPQLVDSTARLLHIYSSANFLFLFFIFALLIKLFTLSVEVSQLRSKLDRIVQESALGEKRDEENMSAVRRGDADAAGEYEVGEDHGRHSL